MLDNSVLLIAGAVVTASSLTLSYATLRATRLVLATKAVPVSLNIDGIAEQLTVLAVPQIAGAIATAILNAPAPPPSLALTTQSDVVPAVLTNVITLAGVDELQGEFTHDPKPANEARLETFRGFPSILVRPRYLPHAPPSALLVPAGTKKFVVQIDGLADLHTDNHDTASSRWESTVERFGVHKFWDREQHVPLRAERSRPARS